MNTLIRFLLIAVALGAIIMISLALTQETYRRYQIQKEIEDLRVQAEKKERDNQKLSGMISYFKTQDFQEKEAKEKLSVQKEGEKVLMVTGDRKSEENSGEEAQSGSAPQKTTGPICANGGITFSPVDFS